MNNRPVSFGSLMAFTYYGTKKYDLLPLLIETSFGPDQPDLKGVYKLEDTFEKHGEVVDGTVHNAAQNFAEKLDEKYKDRFEKGSKKVIITEVEFAVGPSKKENRYFITAATNYDEDRIHKALSKTNEFFIAKFRNKI